MKRWSTPLCVLAVVAMGVVGFLSLAMTDAARPIVHLKAGPTWVDLGKSVRFRGTVNHFLATFERVHIELGAPGSKPTSIKTLTLTKPGVFTWVMKPRKAGKWVFVAAYKVGSEVTFYSKPTTVIVRG